nr:isopeptide-forming domain-containing fimbrial protein [uncultured Roseococcus sp.]
MRITFRSVIEENYVQQERANHVVEGDVIGNDVTVSGEVLGTGHIVTDDSGAGVTLPVATVSKTVYAVNGNVVGGPIGPIQTGDSVTYRLEVDLPLTRAHGLRIIDFLPLPIFGAMDVNGDGVSGDTLVFVDAINGAAPGVGLAWFGMGDTFSGITGATPSISGNAAANSLIFDFGDLGNHNENTKLVILFTVRVKDTPFGDGLFLTNMVTTEETSTDNVVTVHSAVSQIVLGEPVLSITKGVVATTGDGTFSGSNGPVEFNAPGSSGPRFTGVISSDALAGGAIDANLAGVDAGDLVTFALTVENKGSGPYGAFDVLLRDTFPSGFEIPAGGLNLRITDGAGNVLNYEIVGGGLFDPNGGIKLIDPPGHGAIGTYNAGNGGNIVIVTYDLVLADDVSVPNAQLDNTARIVSFAAVEGGNDRIETISAQDASDSARVITAAPSLEKIVFETSHDFTGTGAGNPDVTDLAIGEMVTYHVTVTFPEGKAGNVRLEDLLPAGSDGLLGYVSARIISVGGNLSGGAGLAVGQTGTLADRDGDGVWDTITFDFGDVTNAWDNVVNANDRVVIEIVARVLDVAANKSGEVLTNNATLSIDDPNGGPRVTWSDSASVEIVEPDLTLTKTVTPERAGANEELTYTITLKNDGAGGHATTAFDLEVLDSLAQLPPNATFLAGSVVVSGAVASVATGNTVGDTSIRVTLAQLAVGETLTITFKARLVATAEAGASIPNTANYTGNSLPGSSPDERQYSGHDDALVTVLTPTLSKTIVVTSNPDTDKDLYDPTLDDLSIGEEVTYELVITLPEGDSLNLSLLDLLPDANLAGQGGRLEYVAGSLEVIRVGIGGSLIGVDGQNLLNPGVTVTDTGSNGNLDSVLISFGHVRNTSDNQVVGQEDQIVIRLKARVVDHVANVGGQVLTNTGAVSVNGVETDRASVSAEVVEPRLVIEKTSSVTEGEPLDAGAAISYTITISHADANSGPAYDLNLSDVLPAGMQLVDGSLTSSVGTISHVGGVVTLTLPKLLLGDAPITIVYRAVLLDSVTPGQSLTNTATLDYDSLAGDGPDDRGAPQLSDSETHLVALTPTITKTVVSTSLDETGSDAFDPLNPDVAAGETVTYRLVISLGEGTQRLVVSDMLAPGLTYLSSSVDSLGGITGSVLGIGASGSASGQTITFDFGTVVNTGDNVRNASDEIVILITARLTAAKDVAAGTTYANDAEVQTFGPGEGQPGLETDNATAVIDLVTPVLTIDKVADVTTAKPGDTVTYTVTIDHATTSTSAAYGAILQDLLPTGAVLVAGSASTTRGSVSEEGGQVVLTLPGVYGLNDGPIVLTYQVLLQGSLRNGDQVVNTAGIDYNTAPTNGNNYTGDDDATVDIITVNSLTKEIIATSNEDTAGNDVARGESVTYRLTATVGNGTQELVLTDSIPVGFDFVSYRIVKGPNVTPTITGSVITFNFGTYVHNPGDPDHGTIIVEIVTRLRDDAPADPLANVAVLTPDGDDDRSVTDNQDIVVVSPVLTIQKEGPAGFLRPGQEGEFTLTLSHAAASTAAAYDILVQDLLADAAPWLILIPGSVTTTAGSVTAGNNAGDNTIGISLDSLKLGETVVIKFKVRVADDAPVAAVLHNTATLSWDSNPGEGGEAGTDEDSTQVPLVPGLDKTLEESSVISGGDPTDSIAYNPNLRDLSPGELVRYQIVITLPQGATNGVVVSDDMAGGLLDLISSRIVSIGSDLTVVGLGVGDAGVMVGGVLRFNFGTVTGLQDNALPGAGDRIVIEVIGRVRADVQAGEGGLSQGATLDFELAGQEGSQVDTVVSDIVTPTLTIIKAADTTGPVDGNDAIVYTLTVTNNSNAVAFDVVVTDPLLQLAAGGNVVVTVNGVPVAGVQIISGSAPGDTAVTVIIPQLDVGQVAIISFTGVVSELQASGTTVDNQASVSWGSAPTVDPDGWPGAGGTNPNVATSGEDSNEVSIPTKLPTLTKVVADTDNPGTTNGQFDPNLADVSPGETVTWRLTITLQEGSTTLILRDLLPAGFTYISSGIVSIGGNVSGGNLAVGDAGTLNGRIVVFGFGTLVTRADNTPQGAADQIVIEVRARLDAGALPPGAQPANSAQLEVVDAGVILPPVSAAVDVVAPALAIDKSVDKPFAIIGQEVGYTLRIRHTDASSAGAYDLVIRDDAMPGFLSIVAGSVVVEGVSGAVVEYVGGGIRIIVPELALHQVVTVTYKALVTNVPNDGRATNAASFTADSFPGRPQGGDLGGELRMAGADQKEILVAAGQPAARAGGLQDIIGWDDRLTNFFRGYRSEPIYSGTADPGSTLVISLRDWQGSIIASTSRMADAGGNWIAAFPRTVGFPGDLPNTDDYLSATRLFRDLGQRLVPTGDRQEIPLRDDLDGRPFDVQVSITRNGAGPLGDAPGNTRVAFGDTSNPGAFVKLVDGAAGSTAGGMLRGHAAAAAHPFSFAFNRFTGELLSSGPLAGSTSR